MSQDRIAELENQIAESRDFLKQSEDSVAKLDPEADDYPDRINDEGGRQRILKQRIEELTAELDKLR